jgi:3-hydroxyisobutyrate dehydrogenase-like beta-hydroxyacid dehydrogenase
VVKLAGNFLIAGAVEAMAEAFAMAEKNGVAPQAVHDFFSQTLFACPIYQSYGRMIVNREYEPAGFSLPLGLKDVQLFENTGYESRVPTPLASLLRERMIASLAKGRGQMDWTSFALEVSEAAGL